MSDAYVRAQLKVTYQRVHEAVDLMLAPTRAEDESRWRESCAVREAEVFASEPVDWPIAGLNLSPTETRVLWLMIAHEVAPSVRLQLRELDTEQREDLSCDVIRRVVYGSGPSLIASRELGVAGVLQRRCLIEPVGGMDVPLHRLPFRVDPRVLALVDGEQRVDPALQHVVVERPASSLETLVVDAETVVACRGAAAQCDGIMLLAGLGGSGRRSLWTAIALETNRTVLAVDARRLSPELKVFERQARVIDRECALLRCLPLFLNVESLQGDGDTPDRIEVLERVIAGLVLATCARGLGHAWTRTVRMIELRPLSGSHRAALWSSALPGASRGDAERLAVMYPLAPALVSAVGRAALAEANGGSLSAAHVSKGLRTVLDHRLAGLAKRIDVTQRWTDLILPDDQTAAVVELLARVRARRRVYEDWSFAEKLGKGFGVTALFSGPPGTGKSMCAGLIASDLGTEIYVVDLSKVVSKWIGETEKNLAKLFDAAEAGHAVLLFDEADTLFGKRTTVANSNDRHANEQTNYLLQRIEAFSGICILTTNHDPAIDEAFRRRLTVHVRFPMPDEDERQKLWRAMFPPRAPVTQDLDLAVVARKFVMGGGHIRNAVLRAAFLAADANESIGNYHVQQAAKLEYESLGRIVTEPR